MYIRSWTLNIYCCNFKYRMQELNARVIDSLFTGISKHWLKECEMKLNVQGLAYGITEVSNQSASKIWMQAKLVISHSSDTCIEFLIQGC